MVDHSAEAAGAQEEGPYMLDHSAQEDPTPAQSLEEVNIPASPCAII